MSSDEKVRATTPASAPAATAHSSAPFSLTVEHPRLLETDADYIQTFLRKYDQYCYEVSSRARQISGTDAAEPVSPVEIKFCVDVDFLGSSIDLGFIDGADSYDTITSDLVRSFLESRAKESKEIITLKKLDKIVAEELRMNMWNTDATARMQDLFSQYHTILRRNGLKWIINENQKIAVGQVLSAIQPLVLRDRLTSDLLFSHHHLKKDFPGFMKHSIELAKAFQLVDCEPRRTQHSTPSKRSGNKERETSSPPNRNNNTTNTKNGDKKAPVCL